MKRPSFQFYPGDWLHDAALRLVSCGARGAWIDMICIMHQADPYGYLKVNDKVILPANLARMIGSTLTETEGWLSELQEAGVCSKDNTGCIFCRRMIRDEELRQVRAAGGKLGGNPKLKEGQIRLDERLTLEVKQNPTPSSSSSSSNTEDQKHVPQAARFAEFWAVYPIKRAKKSAESKWKQKRLDAKADELIADVKRRVRDDQQWRDGFAPHASTYLHQERWTDELAGRKQSSVPSTPSPSCHLPAAIKRTTPEELEARRKVGEAQIKKIESMLPAMRVNA